MHDNAFAVCGDGLNRNCGERSRARQWQLWKFLEENLANLTPEGLAAQLRLLRQWIVIYLERAYTQLPVVTFTREAIQLEGPARDKALRKLQLLENALLSPIPNPRPM